MIVDDEALEECLPFVVAAREGEHRQVPGSGDGEDHQRAGQDPQPAQAMPFSGDGAVDERRRSRERESEDPLRERGEADEHERGDRPRAVVGLLLGQEDDEQARHGSGEEADEDGIGDRLPRQHHQERRGEQREGGDRRRPARDEPARGDEEEDRSQRCDYGERQPHAPFGVDADPAVGAVGAGEQHPRRHEPQIERRLGEEVRGLPPGMDVVAPRDHLAGGLAVVRLPWVPESGRPEPGNEEQRREGREADHQPGLAGKRREPAQEGDLQEPWRERIAPRRRRNGSGFGR